MHGRHVWPISWFTFMQVLPVRVLYHSPFKSKCKILKDVTYITDRCKSNQQTCKPIHNSFDFAQQVHLPRDLLWLGRLYFFVTRKVGLFGVCCEGIPKYVNYIIVEGHPIFKGLNALVSYLHHFLEFWIWRHRLHCNNCSGVNKKHFVLW